MVCCAKLDQAAQPLYGVREAADSLRHMSACFKPMEQCPRNRMGIRGQSAAFKSASISHSLCSSCDNSSTIPNLEQPGAVQSHSHSVRSFAHLPRRTWEAWLGQTLVADSFSRRGGSGASKVTPKKRHILQHSALPFPPREKSLLYSFTPPQKITRFFFG